MFLWLVKNMPFKEEENDLVNFLCVSVELCLEIADLFPKGDMYDQMKDIFYDQASFLMSYKLKYQFTPEDADIALDRYSTMIEEVRKIKNAKT